MHRRDGGARARTSRLGRVAMLLTRAARVTVSAELLVVTLNRAPELHRRAAEASLGATGVDTGGVETLDADSAGEADTASREPMSDSTATDDVGDRGGNGF